MVFNCVQLILALWHITILGVFEDAVLVILLGITKTRDVDRVGLGLKSWKMFQNNHSSKMLLLMYKHKWEQCKHTSTHQCRPGWEYTYIIGCTLNCQSTIVSIHMHIHTHARTHAHTTHTHTHTHTRVVSISKNLFSNSYM